MLGYLEAELLRLDKIVLAAGGICDESLLKLYDKQRLAREEIWHLEEAASGLKSKLEILMLKREDLREKHKGAFEHLTGSKKKKKRRDDADGFDEILELDADYLRDIQIVRVEMKENEAALKKKKKANNDLHDSVFEVEGERSPLPQPLRLCLNLCVFASSSAPLPQSLRLCLNLCVFAPSSAPLPQSLCLCLNLCAFALVSASLPQSLRPCLNLCAPVSICASLPRSLRLCLNLCGYIGIRYCG